MHLLNNNLDNRVRQREYLKQQLKQLYSTTFRGNQLPAAIRDVIITTIHVNLVVN